MTVPEILPGLSQLSARHPEWSEDEDGWDPDVAWWIIDTPEGVLLIDPLVEDWAALDARTAARGGVLAIVRTCWWHQRSIPEAAERYGVPVLACGERDGTTLAPCEQALADGEALAGGITVARMERRDELALWLPAHDALVFGDAMLRGPDGVLGVCPDSWTQPPGGRIELLARLGRLAERRPVHVLVSHGPLVLGDGADALERALA